MKVNNSVKYSALFFLIFIFGIIFIVASVNKSLDKKSEVIKIDQSSNSRSLVSTFPE